MASSKKAARKAGTQGRRGLELGFFRDGEVTHSPIIITDGSASIQFDAGEYADTGTDTRLSTELILREIFANREHPITDDPLRDGDPPGSPICHGFTGSALYEVRVTCEAGGNQMNFVIIGRRSGSSASPIITFSHAMQPREYREGANFPATRPGARRFGNANRRITKLEIFRAGILVHNCPLVPVAVGERIQYTISDAHG